MMATRTKAEIAAAEREPICAAALELVAAQGAMLTMVRAGLPVTPEMLARETRAKMALWILRGRP